MVDAGAHDQFAAIRLADIDMHRARHHHRVEDRFDRLGNQGLERMAFDRQAQIDHGGGDAGMAGRG